MVMQNMIGMMFAVWLIACGEPAADGTGQAHVFLKGGSVRILLADEYAKSATKGVALTERLLEVEQRDVADGAVDFGALPVGWYRIELRGADGALAGFTTAAVLEPLSVQPPDNSPVALDIALSWLGAKDESDWPLYAQLARLAGVRWVRDRIHWREMQSEDGAFAEHTKYDDSAAIQSAEDLRILQVFHTIPKWALAPDSNPGRPRMDLTKLHAYCKGMAERFHGKVLAWEPWNEGNGENFGGYTLDELCTIQKTAYLGFKAGDPALTVCWNPLGGVNIETQTRTVLRNETWPYYDVYSIHSYDWPEAYEQLWAHAREAACGKPIWVTECDRGMEADPASEMRDFAPENDRRKAELVTQSVVRSLFSGSCKHFHFILGDYCEGKTQFGLLRRDHTPRPGYVALATLGRLLAGGVCLGRHEVDGQPNVHLYGFRALPQGHSKDVLVAWAERAADWPDRGKERVAWPIREPLNVEAAYDYLGRPLNAEVPAELRPDAVFIVVPHGALDNFSWRTVPKAAVRIGAASPIVLQFDLPAMQPVQRTIGWSPEAAYEFSAGTTLNATLTVYNFGKEAARGSVILESLARGWNAESAKWELSLEPMQQKSVPVRVTIAPDVPAEHAWLDFRGAFGDVGNPALSVWSRNPAKR